MKYRIKRCTSPNPATLFKKGTLAHAFSFSFSELFKNTFFSTPSQNCFIEKKHKKRLLHESRILTPSSYFMEIRKVTAIINEMNMKVIKE